MSPASGFHFIVVLLHVIGARPLYSHANGIFVLFFMYCACDYCELQSWLRRIFSRIMATLLLALLLPVNALSKTLGRPQDRKCKTFGPFNRSTPKPSKFTPQVRWAFAPKLAYTNLNPRTCESYPLQREGLGSCPRRCPSVLKQRLQEDSRVRPFA